MLSKSFFIFLVVLLLFVNMAGAEAPEHLRTSFEEAREIHFSVNQQDCLDMFSKLIENLNEELNHLNGIEAREILDMLLDSHMYMGITYFNLGQSVNANREFLKIVKINPDYKPDDNLISRTIINAFNKVRDDNSGLISIKSSPKGANVYIDGIRIGATPIEKKRTLYGSYELILKLDNFATETEHIEFIADMSINKEMERIYASLEITTKPPDVNVFLNDRLVGITSSDSYYKENTAIFSHTDLISDPLIINEVPLGTNTLSFKSNCYKTLDKNILLESAQDFELETVALVKHTGSVELIGDIEESAIFINDFPVIAKNNIISDLCFGDHIIKVVDKYDSVWFSQISIDSTRRILREVSFNPLILWLGIYDRNYNYYEDGNIKELNKMLEGLENYNFIFDSLSSDDRFQLFFEYIRGKASKEKLSGNLKALSEQYSFDMIAFGIIDPISLDREADIYFFHYSHPVPEIAKLSTRESALIYNFISNLDKDMLFTENWLGIDVLPDPVISEGLVIINVYPNSPGSASGLQPYDIIISIDNFIVNSNDELRDILSGFSRDDTISLVIDRSGKIMEKELSISLLPIEYSFIKDHNYNLLLANLHFQLRRENLDFYRDIYYLNLGLSYMHFRLYEKALNEGFSRIKNYQNLGLFHGSPELYSGICYFYLGDRERARTILSSAALRDNAVFGPYPYYSVSNMARFYLFLAGGSSN